MSEVLKGNFKPMRPVEVADSGPQSLEQRFESEALRKLGGSIAFVSKQKVFWGPDEALGDDRAGSSESEPSPAAADPGEEKLTR